MELSIDKYLETLFINENERNHILTILTKLYFGKIKHHLIIFKGNGNNGKSSFITLIASIPQFLDNCIFLDEEPNYDKINDNFITKINELISKDKNIIYVCNTYPHIPRFLLDRINMFTYSPNKFNILCILFETKFTYYIKNEYDREICDINVKKLKNGFMAVIEKYKNKELIFTDKIKNCIKELCKDDKYYVNLFKGKNDKI